MHAEVPAVDPRDLVPAAGVQLSGDGGRELAHLLRQGTVGNGHGHGGDGRRERRNDRDDVKR